MSFSDEIGEYLIIENFLSSSLVNEIIALMKDNYPCDDNNYIPYRFSEIDWSNLDLSREQTERFVNLMNPVFLKDFNSRIRNIFPSVEVKSIEEVNSDFRFNPVTIRVLHPGKVDIHHHCENMSHGFFPEMFKRLGEVLKIENQYSFLLMLQPPESGGEIVIYNQEWNGMETFQSEMESLQELDRQGGTDHVKQVVSLNAGDLLIFPAGKVWHKVNQVTGSLPRITMGGFAGKSKKEADTVYLWS